MRAQDQIPRNYWIPVIFTLFVYVLLSFSEREFSTKSETRELGEIIVEFTSYHI